LDYYTSGGTAGCPALLVEPSAQNLCLQSQDFMTTWGVSNTTRTANQATSPDNTLTADRISITSNGGYIRQLLATSNSLTYTLSCFVKNDAVASGDTFRLYFNNNLGGGNAAVANATININAGTVSAGSSGAGVSSVSASIENYGNGWYRVRLTFTLGASAGNASSEIGLEAPTATRTFFAWGAQLETGSVATSYIPTTAAAVTRNADVVTLSGAVSGCIGQTEGTIYWEGDALVSGSQDILFINRNVSNSVVLFKGGTNLISARVYASGGIALTISDTVSRTGFLKIAVAYKSGDSTLYINGTRVGTLNTTAFTFTAALNTIRFGDDAFLLGRGDQRCRAVAVYSTRLTDSELAALTT
jgi:hypothetical protein